MYNSKTNNTTANKNELRNLIQETLILLYKNIYSIYYGIVFFLF